MAYMPYSWACSSTYGQAGYERIATVFLDNLQETLHIRGSRRLDRTPFDLYFQADGNGGIRFFYADFPVLFDSNYPFSAFVYSTSSMTFDIYVQKINANDWITVWVEAGQWTQGGNATITYSPNVLSSVPSGATMATPVPYSLGYNNAKTLLFQIPGNTAIKISGKTGGEILWLIGITGWNQNIRDGLYFISGYNDSSRSRISTLSSASSILINAVSGELAYTITNNSITIAEVSVLVLWGDLPTLL
jgi:hypothetical protein